VADHVHRDLDPPSLSGDGVGVLVDGLLVERVYLGGLGRPSRRADLLGDLLERRPGAAG
jgi:hypothetical protein